MISQEKEIFKSYTIYSKIIVKNANFFVHVRTLNVIQSVLSLCNFIIKSSQIHFILFFLIRNLFKILILGIFETQRICHVTPELIECRMVGV